MFLSLYLFFFSSLGKSSGFNLNSSIMSKDSFLPSDYEVPMGGGDQFMRFEQGENIFRILSKPLLGFEYWKDVANDDGSVGRQPVRVRMDDRIPPEFGEGAKHFWGVKVFNYKKKCIQALMITQKGIQRDIASLSKDDDWGNPAGYDLVVTREGEGLETQYSLKPKPKKPLSKEVKDMVANTPFTLETLYDGGYPMGESKPAIDQEDDLSEDISDDLPF